MKLKYQGKDVYVLHVSTDADYAIVTYDKTKKGGSFKVLTLNLEGLTEKDMPKFKKFITMG